MKKIVPVNEQVLIRRLPPPKDDASKIALPDSYQKSAYALGEVLAVAPGGADDPPPCKVEDVVLFYLGKDAKAEENPAAIIAGYGDCVLVQYHEVVAVIQ